MNFYLIILYPYLTRVGDLESKKNFSEDIIIIIIIKKKKKKKKALVQ